MTKDILLIAGEVSGDMHGACLLKELKKHFPDTNFFGIGGDNLEEAGLEPLFHISQMAFLGFIEVVRHLPFITKVKKTLLEEADKRKIKYAILIDYPGFNINIARSLHKRGIKVFYYISPQLWAWGEKRVKKIRKYIYRMLVVFPFEKEFYENHGIKAEFTGHPLIERIGRYPFLTRDEFLKKYKLDTSKEILLLMPGSRKNEIIKILEPCMKAALMLSEKFDMQIVVAEADGINLDEIIKDSRFRIIDGDTYNLMKHAKFGIVKSGTSTLESALIGLPYIVVYKTASLTYFIAKQLIKLKNIAIVNILSGKQLVPELIQDKVNPEDIFNSASRYIENIDEYIDLKKELKYISEILGSKKASENAASLITGYINE